MLGVALMHIGSSARHGSLPFSKSPKQIPVAKLNEYRIRTAPDLVPWSDDKFRAYTPKRNSDGMWTCPPAIREAATGIFLWPAWGLFATIKGDKFKHINFSHD